MATLYDSRKIAPASPNGLSTPRFAARSTKVGQQHSLSEDTFPFRSQRLADVGQSHTQLNALLIKLAGTPAASMTAGAFTCV